MKIAFILIAISAALLIGVFFVFGLGGEQASSDGRWMGPYRSEWFQCATCGRMRVTETRSGKVVSDVIEESATSKWADRVVPDNGEHKWSLCSAESRSEWFGPVLNACGGTPGMDSLHAFSRKFSEAEARPLIDEYFATLPNGSEAIATFFETKVDPKLYPPQ